MPRRVAGRMERANAGQNLALTLYEVESGRFGDGNEVVREIAPRGALVGVSSKLVLAALNDVPRVRKRKANIAIRIANGVAAGVVEVEMGVDDECDVFRSYADVEKPVLEPCRSALPAILYSVDIV